MMNAKPKIICLTPVRNEVWILDRFLKCASLWADHIIIADQGSDDGSRDIARCFEKVILIDNPSPTFNEPERQKLLIEEARKIPGLRILIALDADECLTANFMTSPEWETVLSALPGTGICFRWVNLRPDLKTYWDPQVAWVFGFMDDGSEHTGPKIHSTRVPMPIMASYILLHDIRVLHYQYTDWDRTQSKHRWYQCWERIHGPQRPAISIYRQYSHMFAVKPSEIKPLQHEWLAGYTAKGIDMTSVHRQPYYYWDKEVLGFFAQYGTAKFKREAIWDWDIDWSKKAQQIGIDTTSLDLRDPRSRLDMWIHRWLRYTRSRANDLSIRLTHLILELLRW